MRCSLVRSPDPGRSPGAECRELRSVQRLEHVAISRRGIGNPDTVALDTAHGAVVIPLRATELERRTRAGQLVEVVEALDPDRLRLELETERAGTVDVLAKAAVVATMEADSGAHLARTERVDDP